MIQTQFNFDPCLDRLKSRIATGAIITGGGQFVRLAAQFASTIILSRLLEPKDFGIVAMVWPVFVFVGIFQDIGLSQATINKPELTNGQASLLFWANLGAACLLACGVLAAAPAIAAFFHVPALSALTAAYGALLAVNGVGAQHRALLTRQMRFDVLAISDAGSAILGFLASVLTALLWPSYWALYIGTATSALFSLAVVWVSLRWVPSRPTLQPGFGSLITFGAGVTGFNLANYFARNLDNILIGRAFGGVVLGYYDCAYKMLLFPLQQVNSPLTRVMLPALARVVVDPPRYRSSYLRLVRLTLLIALPGIVFLIIYAGSVIPALLGEQWRESARIYVWLGFAGLVQPLNNLSGVLFLSQGRIAEYASSGAIFSTVLAMSFFLGLPYGVLGVAAAYALAEILVTPLLWWAATRSGPVAVADIISAVAPNALATAASFAAVTTLHIMTSLTPWIAIPLGASLSYSTTILVLGLFDSGRNSIRDLYEIFMVALSGSR